MTATDPAIAAEASTALVRAVRAPVFTEQVAAALPENVPARRFVRATITALMANPDLALSDHSSVLNALMQAAQDGLAPDGNEAALVLYKGKAQYLPMIGGIRRIAAEHGWSIETRVVRERDEFDYELGLDSRLTHYPARGNRGELVYAYAIGRHRDGRREFEVMDAADIAKRRNVSRAKEAGPWRDWTERMWEKTVGHALFKRLPLDPADKRVQRLIALDDLEPGEAATRLYGHEPVRGELPPRRAPSGELGTGEPTPAQGTPADAGNEEATGGSQAPAGGEQEAAGGAPSDEPVVDIGEHPAADLEAALEAARAVVFTRGANKGKALGAIAAAPGSLTWFGWALNNLDTFDDETAAAVRLVAEHDVPDAWAKHVDRREATT